MPRPAKSARPRIGIYLRISKDRDGTQTATERQEQDCRAWAERNAAEIVEVYEDVDTSAFNRKIKRPEFDRLLRDVKAGRLDGVVAWKVDRIARRQRDFVLLDEVCEDVGAFIATVADGIDTRHNRIMAELLVSFARQEAENMSLRLKRRNEQVADLGQPHAGGRRPFGYTGGVTREIVPAEAELIREAATRVLAGESFNQLAMDWDRRGVRTAAGNPWKVDVISAMLTSPTMIGCRVYKGRVSPTPGWAPILTREQSAAIGREVETRARAMHGPRTKHLLTGIARCGACGHPLWGSSTGSGVYRCPRPALGKGCGGVVRSMRPVEQAVRDMWIAALRSDAFRAALTREYANRTGTDAAVVTASIAEKGASLERLAVDHYADGRISGAEFFAARDALNGQIAALRALLVDPATATLLATGPNELEATWEKADTDQRRRLLLTIMEYVIVAKAGSGHRFSPEQLTPVWRY